ncbi:MAG: BREX-3 system P-loop-containing protein BrxF [candidate division KSB1 bacterium]|nr:BREX-3 system P-loop-containing protein BrxF [candidate division KSB1 bacterium]
MEIATYLLDQLNRMAGEYYHLFLLIAPPGAGKTTLINYLGQELGLPIINLNLALSKQLLELSDRQRALKASQITQDIIRSHEYAITLIDNNELLFDPALQQDPLKLMKISSRDKNIVSTWNGKIKNGKLIYSEPGHPEFRQYHLHEIKGFYWQSKDEIKKIIQRPHAYEI